jgi:hypothetical protein
MVEAICGEQVGHLLIKPLRCLGESQSPLERLPDDLTDWTGGWL